jgi:hypothetical protein
MDAWSRRRGCVYSPSFEESLGRLGLDARAVDDDLGAIENALCGTESAKIDAEYPILVGTLDSRLALTDGSGQLPALRVVFRLIQEDGEKIEWVDVDLRT